MNDRNGPRGGRDGERREGDFRKENGERRESGFRRDNGERREGGFRKENGERREGGFRRENGERREGSFRRDNGERREDGFRRDNGERREGGFRRDNGERREGGFRKENGERREGGFRRDNGERREGGFRRDNGERREGAYRRDNGERREGSFRRDNGGHREGGFRRDNGERREGGFRRDNGGQQRTYRSSFRSESSGKAPVRRGPGARDVALTAFRLVSYEGAYASEALDRAMRTAQLSDEDRAFAASVFYTALEKKLYLEWVLDKRVEERPEQRVWDILTIAAAQLLAMGGVEDYAAVNEAVEQARRNGMEGLTGLVNAVLKGVISLRDAEEADMPSGNTPEDISVRCSVSLEIANALIEAYGIERTEEMLAFRLRNDETCVRPDLLSCTIERFEAWLTEKGYEWKRGTVPETYLIKGAGRMAALPEFGEGMFSIQSESSVLAAMAVQPKVGEHILDACAAPGGKTCWIAEHMMDTGRVYAWDLHAHRVDLIKAAAKRLGLDNIRATEHDGRELSESMVGTMDAVLVDAPCSGLGVMADKPDIRYRLGENDIASLTALQAQLLENSAQYVVPGGRLVYSTCTVLPQENARQVERFLSEHPEYEADTDTTWLPEALRPLCENGMLQLLPNVSAAEGFFIARMRRKLG